MKKKLKRIIEHNSLQSSSSYLQRGKGKLSKVSEDDKSSLTPFAATQNLKAGGWRSQLASPTSENRTAKKKAYLNIFTKFESFKTIASRSQDRSKANGGAERATPKRRVIIEKALVERSFEIKKSEIIRVVFKPHQREREGVESKRELVMWT